MSQDAGHADVTDDDLDVEEEALDPVGALSYDDDAEPEVSDDADDEFLN